jgi:NAD-dependent deacetylase
VFTRIAREAIELEAQLGDRFLLVTQNVDGLHRRAGSSRERTYEIHGRIDEMRCYLECSPELLPIPAAIPTAWPKDRRIGEEERALLRCPRCGSRTRPHVLWFDESYDEQHFRYESSLAAVERTDLLLVIGTSGATSLPHRLVVSCLRLGTSVVVLNLDESPFSAWRPGGERVNWKTRPRAVPAITRCWPASLGSSRSGLAK